MVLTEGELYKGRGKTESCGDTNSLRQKENDEIRGKVDTIRKLRV